ncbi:MAG: hypothetical protein PHU25_18045 [Deltaproteobacteria bacterium]|nr:hypothetical protein [Deltaproteobacteria bacterium]
MTRDISIILAVLLATGLACAWPGCSGTGASHNGDDDGSGSPDGGHDASVDTDTGTDTASGGCTEAAKNVYVVDSDTTLYRFDPPSKVFDPIGKIGCPSGGSPFSMAVARDGTAYVLFWDGMGACVALNKVSTEDASCLGKTKFVCGAHGFNTFGMGFATDGPDTTEETLYIGKAENQPQLASVDLDTFALNIIGPISGAPEMTGNGAGELWAFFAWETPSKVAQLDKASGAESNIVQIDQLQGSAAFAFAFWGGDFYIFHAPADNTTVWKLSNGVLTSYMADTGTQIVGAGVSTCAPLKPE